MKIAVFVLLILDFVISLVASAKYGDTDENVFNKSAVLGMWLPLLCGLAAAVLAVILCVKGYGLSTIHSNQYFVYRENNLYSYGAMLIFFPIIPCALGLGIGSYIHKKRKLREISKRYKRK